MKIENISDLRVLLQTAQTGSLTRAAAVLGITPAAASATLKRVEGQLGTRLFERSTRAMRLTPAGQTMLDYASRAFELIGEGEAQATADTDTLIGRVRLSAPSDLARTVLLPWLDEFLEQNAGVKLDLSIGDRTADILRDELDLSIRYGTLADSRLVARQLIAPHPVVVASPGYLAKFGAPASPADLGRHNCLLYDRAGRLHRNWQFSRDDQWVEVSVQGNRHVNDASLARQWALAGAGILLKSPLEQMQDMVEGRLVRLLSEWQTEAYPLYAVLPSGRFIPRRLRALVDYLAAKFEGMQATMAAELGRSAPQEHVHDAVRNKSR